MKLNLDSEWQAILADEIEKPYFHDLMEKVDEEYKLHACYPPKDLVFSITAVLGKSSNHRSRSLSWKRGG
jgi:uracil DNA glycosylase